MKQISNKELFGLSFAVPIISTLLPYPFHTFACGFPLFFSVDSLGTCLKSSSAFF